MSCRVAVIACRGLASNRRLSVLAAAAPPALSSRQRKALRAHSHSLGAKLAVVQVGKNGLTPGVSLMLEEALRAHELVKVRISDNSDDDCDAAATLLSSELGAAVYGQIGGMCGHSLLQVELTTQIRRYCAACTCQKRRKAFVHQAHSGRCLKIYWSRDTRSQRGSGSGSGSGGRQRQRPRGSGGRWTCGKKRPRSSCQQWWGGGGGAAAHDADRRIVVGSGGGQRRVWAATTLLLCARRQDSTYRTHNG
jgi:RNA-binding protein